MKQKGKVLKDEEEKVFPALREFFSSRPAFKCFWLQVVQIRSCWSLMIPALRLSPSDCLAAKSREKMLNDAVSRAIKTLSSRFLYFRLVRDSYELNENNPRAFVLTPDQKVPRKFISATWTHAKNRDEGINFSVDDRATLSTRSQVRDAGCVFFFGVAIATLNRNSRASDVDVNKLLVKNHLDR